MYARLGTRTKKLFVLAGSLIVVAGVLVVVAKASAGDLFTGYIWSSNIGLIKVSNCDNATSCSGTNYGVAMDPTTGNLSGYAWSSNIGWVSFNSNATSNCPNAPSLCQARVDLTSGKVSGWARVCSVFSSADCTSSQGLAQNASLGSWDGWISLGDDNTSDTVPFGVTINLATGQASGYAWGSDVLGWLDFSGVKVDTSNSCTVGTPCYCAANPTDTTNCPNSCAVGSSCYCAANPTDTTNCPGNCPVGSACWCALPGNASDPRCTSGGGGTGECSNIPGQLVKDWKYRTAPDSNGDGGTQCLCSPGYVLNSQYQCVHPSYTEQ